MESMSFQGHITRDNLPNTVITCAKAYRQDNKPIGYTVYGHMLGVDAWDKAHLIFHFRDNQLEVAVPLEDVRTVDQGCHTCVHRLSRLVGDCCGEYKKRIDL